MKVSKREKTLLIAVLLLGLICVYYLFYLKPYLADISELNITKANNEIQVQTYEQLKNNVDSVNEKIAEKKEEIQKNSSNISIGFDQPSLLVYLEKTVGDYAQKNMFVFGTSEYSGQMILSPVTVTMTTTYAGLKSFIEAVTTGEYIISISSISAMIASAEQTVNEEIAATDEIADNADSNETREGVITVQNSENLIDVTIELRIYSMSGTVPLDKEYSFDDNSYEYGGDMFY